MKRLLSTILTLTLLVGLFPVISITPVSAKEDLSQTWNTGSHYGTPNSSATNRKYTVIPCQAGDVIQFTFPSDNWAVYVRFADANGDFGVTNEYRKGLPECVVIQPLNGRTPTEIRLTTFYRPDSSSAITDEIWATFDVSISKSTLLPGDLLHSVTWNNGSYDNPAATIRRYCQIPCTVGDTFRFDFNGDFWDIYILPGDENGAITSTNTYLTSDKTYTVQPVDGKNPTNLILVAVPGYSQNIVTDGVWPWTTFSISCIKESDLITVATQNYGLWFNGVTQGVEAANVETAAARWQQMVLDNGIDILCGQEWLPHFDRDKTIDANNKVFGKLFEHQFAQNTSTYDGKHIASRTPLTNTQYITHSNGSGRTYAKTYTQINGKSVCIINAHLSFEDDINIHRKKEMVELLAAAQGEKYAIIAGDFNVFTPEEFQLFVDAGYSIANAGAFGEFNTCPNFDYNADADVNRCIDNIIVNSGIAIRDAYVDYRRLSDHAMLVAKLELLEDDEIVDTRLFCDHCNQKVDWLPCPLTNSGTITQNGHFYLTDDLTSLTNHFVISATDVVLDLRGHSIHAPSTRACYITRGNKISIVDTIGCGVVSSDYTSTGAVAYVEGTGELALYSGTVWGKDTTTAKKGGAIYAEGGAKITVAGGTLRGGYGSDGGVICGGNNNVINITGGTIYGCNASLDGGAIYLYNGTVNMSGGTIIGGNAPKGGAIYASTATLNLTGGTISGGTATVSGGNIQGTGNSSSGSLNLGGTVITGGTAPEGKDIFLTSSGKINVHSDYAGTASLKLDAAHLTQSTPGSALSSSLDSCEGPFSGQLLLENLAGTPSLCGVSGDTKLYIGAAALQKANGTKQWYVSNNAAIANYEESAILQPAAGALPLSGGNYTVDVAGKVLSVTGSGTFRGIDSTNDDFQLSSGKATIANTVTILPDVTIDSNGYRYIALKADDGSYSFHRLEMRLKDVTLRTEGAGVYYKALYNCDDVLCGQVEAYGVALSVFNMPGADFMTEAQEGNNNRYTRITTPLEKGVIATSGSVLNIMKDSNANLLNYINGNKKIYANPYITLKGGLTLVTDNKNPGKTADDASFDGISHSLFDVMRAIDGRYDRYTEEQQAVIESFYAKWKNKGLQLQLENIK